MPGSNYYFLASALPYLVLKEPPDLPFKGAIELLKANITRKDFEKIVVIRRWTDINNLQALWREEPIDYRGNLNELDWNEMLTAREGLPNYLKEFLDHYDSDKKRLEHFPELISRFFQEELPNQRGFLKWYLSFEREWRLVMVGFRAKLLGKDLAFELRYEDPENELVAQIMAQKDAKNFEPPEQYEDLKILFEGKGNNPLEFYKALNEYRFNKIGEYSGDQLFTLDGVLGYIAQLIIAEKWHELDAEKGQAIVNSMMKV